MSDVDTISSGSEIKLVEWLPTGLKVGVDSACPTELADDLMGNPSRSVGMLANHTGVTSLFRRVTGVFDIMYSQRCYVHWYVGEGMEEGEFSEAREEMEALLSDYRETLLPESAKIKATI